MSSPSSERRAIEAALDRALRDTSAQSVLFSQAVADRVGMNPTDLESLDMLARHGPMTAGRLAEITGLTTGAITGLVDRLERRSVIVRPLIENAERDLGPAYVTMGEAMNDLMSRYDDEDLATILDFMTRAATITAEQIARLRSQTGNHS